MNDAMKAALKEVQAARVVLSEKMDALREVCDHQDEVGSWDRVYDAELDRNVCRHCGRDL